MEESQRHIPDCVFAFFNSYTTFFILGHEDPDMDCVGSQIVLASFLQSLGKQCIILNSGPFRRREILPYMRYFISELSPAILSQRNSAGLIILDCSEWSRTGRIGSELVNMPTLFVDHHESQVTGNHYIDSHVAATALLVYRILQSAKYVMSQEDAYLLFLGLAADTGFFRFARQGEGEIFDMAAVLVNHGVDPRKASEELEGNKSFAAKKFIATAINHAQQSKNRRYIISCLNYNQIQDSEKDSDSLHQILLSTEGCEVIAVLIEDEDSACKGSLRSKQTVDVAAIAQIFGGGGHKCAAGFRIQLPIADVRKMLEEQFEQLLN